MAKIDTLILLVNSMTSAEKRFFNLNTKMHGNQKDYIYLYKLIYKSDTDAEKIKLAYKKQLPSSSFEVSCQHLYNSIIRNISVFEMDKDIENTLIRYYQECKILFDRGVNAEAFKLIEKAKSLASEYEKFSLYCMFARLELDILNQIEFLNLTEDDLIKKQGKLESIARKQRAIDNHSFLYNVIRYRQFKQGPTRNEKDKEKLNDLAFNELQANSVQVKDSFEARKIHLLFQSSYFMMTANPKSSLKVYYELNELFEQNEKFRASPPVFYLQHIQGILQNLRVFRQYDEMPYFIQRIKETMKLDPGAEYLVDYMVYLNESYILTDQCKFKNALDHYLDWELRIQNLQSKLPVITNLELVFQIAYIHHRNGKLREAIQMIRPVLNYGKAIHQHVLFSSVRLLMLMIRYNLGDYEFISYEVRSFERELSKNNISAQTEIIILKLIKQLLKITDKEKSKDLIRKSKEQLNELMINPNEQLRINSLGLMDWMERMV